MTLVVGLEGWYFLRLAQLKLSVKSIFERYQKRGIRASGKMARLTDGREFEDELLNWDWDLQRKR